MRHFLLMVKFIFVIGVVATQGINADHYRQENRNLRVKRQGNKDSLPYLVKLGYTSKYGLLWTCSGALIDSRKVVTSASCLTAKTRDSELKIVNAQGRDFKIAKYETRDRLAVLFLEKPVDFFQNSTCLSSNLKTNVNLVAAGWGGLLPDNQLHGTINKEVAEIDVTAFQVSDDKISVRSMVKSAPCVVDQGGPLQKRSGKRPYLCEIIGVLEEWKNCGEKDSVGSYISLKKYKEWLDKL